MPRFFKPTAGLAAVIIFLILFHYLGWLAPAESWLVKAIAPVSWSIHNFSGGVKSFRNFWLAQNSLLTENNNLQAQLVQCQTNQAQLNNLTAENDLLKRELNFVREKPWRYVSAKIITGVSDPLSQSVVINRGRHDGLIPGLAVIAASGVLVGKISEVGDAHSKVLLLTDNKSRVAATVQNFGQTVGLVEGQFGLSLSMTNIPQNQELREGDLVVTSGLEGQIPRNLIIAKIDSVNQVASEIFKTAILSPIVSFDNLSYVAVIIP
jgi:rod shape-determining protein MreC